MTLLNQVMVSHLWDYNVMMYAKLRLERICPSGCAIYQKNT